MAKILIWDIETSDLRADWGTTLCIGYKWYDESKVHVLSIMDYPGWRKDVTDDSRLVKDFHKIMMEADMYVTYFGKGFDLKWMNTKFLQHGLPILPNTAHVDLFYTAKSNLNLSRKSLDNVSRAFGLEEKKYRVDGDIWKRARVGDPECLKQVIEHCYADILITQQAYELLRPLVRQHPRVSEFYTCRNCGGDHLQRRGAMLSTTKGKKIRFQCMDCAAWSSYSEKDAEEIDGKKV